MGAITNQYLKIEDRQCLRSSLIRFEEKTNLKGIFVFVVCMYLVSDHIFFCSVFLFLKIR